MTDDDRVDDRVGDRTGDPTGAAWALEVVAIRAMLDRYPHAVDARDWDAFSAIFTDDVVCDMSAVALGVTEGRDALVERFDRIDHPVAHHLVNPVVERHDVDRATVASKWLVVLADRTVLSGDYLDEVVRTAQGWRIRRRRITNRQVGSRRPVPPVDRDALDAT